VKLRDYQIKAISATREQLQQGRRAILLVSPTGSGKTIIASEIIRLAAQKKTRVLFLAHREELITQCSNKLKAFGVAHGIIKAGFEASPYQLVQVASVQTFRARAEKLQQGYGLIIHDEAHRAVSEEHMIPRRLNPSAIGLGLTATPCRLDGKGLKGAFDSLVEVSTPQELIDQGHLVPYRTFKSQKIRGLEQLHIQAGDYKQDELAEVMNNKHMVASVIREWSRIAYGRPTVVFASSVTHSKALCEEFNRHGVRAVHVDGTLNREDRAAVFQAFDSRKAMVICNYGICTEGWDCPKASCGIGARPTLSLALYLQMVGRILRLDDNKKDALWLDFGNLTDRHGYITDPHSWTLEGLDAEKEKAPGNKYKCKACGAILKSRPRFCPSCGIDTQAQASFDSEDEGYILIEARPEAPRPVEYLSSTDKLFIRFLSTAKQKQYKPGWANKQYQIRTGKYPDDTLLNKLPKSLKVKREVVDGKPTLVWAA